MERIQRTDVDVELRGRKYYVVFDLQYPSLKQDGTGSECKVYCYNNEGNSATEAVVNEIYGRLVSLEQISDITINGSTMCVNLAISRLNIENIVKMIKAAAKALDFPHSGVKLRGIRQTSFVKVGYYLNNELMHKWVHLNQYLTEKHFR